MRRQNRCIPNNPKNNIIYLIDTNFLAYRYFNVDKIKNKDEKDRAIAAQEYWVHINRHTKKGIAKVFVLDICIAETFKTLAKKYYGNSGVFPNSTYYKNACDRLRKNIQVTPGDAKKMIRKIKFHDIQINRDIIIGVDRFFENVYKKKMRVSVVDLLILSAARYLIDFLGFMRDAMYIVTMDKPLYKLARCYSELPAVFDPAEPVDRAKKVFCC